MKKTPARGRLSNGIMLNEDCNHFLSVRNAGEAAPVKLAWCEIKIEAK